MNAQLKITSILIYLLLFSFLTAMGEKHQTPLEPVYPAEMASGTIPTVYIRTENRDSILDKVTKIPATLYIDVPANSELLPLGSKDAPVSLTIRGRGNATWKLPKKPYKLKFNEATEVLGLPAHRDFALIAWNYGNGNIEWITSVCAMEMARMLGMPWAPHIQPVELVLNDNYEGLYFLTETVKIAPGRLDIYKQPEDNEDPSTIPYGWLVEFDNYYDEPQIVIPEVGWVKLKVTSHSPDRLSEAQLDWLTEEFTTLNEAVYSEGVIDWTERIDIGSLARYFIIREILFDTDGFNGSVYLHRDAGENSKWHFGPIWDVGLGVTPKNDFTMNLLPSYAVAHWERPMLEHPAFHEEFLRVWKDFFPDKFNRLESMALEVARYCEAADVANARRWPELSEKASAENKAALFFRRISQYALWLDANKNWETDALSELRSEPKPGELYDLLGRKAGWSLRRGIYIRDGRKIIL